MYFIIAASGPLVVGHFPLAVEYFTASGPVAAR